MTRASSEIERRGLKTAFKRLISAVGGLDPAAVCSRLGRSQLQRAGDIHLDDTHAPIDVVADLERIAGEPMVTQALAALAGYTLMPVELGDGDVARSLQDVARDAGQTMVDTVSALAGDMPPAAVRRVHTDLTELERHVRIAIGRVSALLQDGAA